MNYLILAAVAFCFCLLGFFLHAVFFDKKEQIQSLSCSNKALREDLGRKEKEILGMRSEMVGLNKHVAVLENQVRRRNAELNSIYNEASRREESLWRKELSTIMDVLNEVEK
jgi:predicted nuclease with TOPRIM domain